jgi:hypothetical protein
VLNYVKFGIIIQLGSPIQNGGISILYGSTWEGTMMAGCERFISFVIDGKQKHVLQLTGPIASFKWLNNIIFKWYVSHSLVARVISSHGHNYGISSKTTGQPQCIELCDETDSMVNSLKLYIYVYVHTLYIYTLDVLCIYIYTCILFEICSWSEKREGPNMLRGPTCIKFWSIPVWDYSRWHQLTKILDIMNIRI